MKSLAILWSTVLAVAGVVVRPPVMLSFKGDGWEQAYSQHYWIWNIPLSDSGLRYQIQWPWMITFSLLAILIGGATWLTVRQLRQSQVPAAKATSPSRVVSQPPLIVPPVAATPKNLFPVNVIPDQAAPEGHFSRN